MRPGPEAGERALLVVNRAAGIGRHEALAESLRARLHAALRSLGDVALAVTTDHDEVRERTAAFVKESSAPAILFVGGGSGTLRAIAEAACTFTGADGPPPAARLRIAPLRMGSGNLVAKALGYPEDPFECAERAAASVRAGVVVPGCVLRVDAGQASSPPRAHFAMAMGGFGAFGRVASDVDRGPRDWPRTRAGLASMLGIETWTNVEYRLAIAARCLAAVARPSTCDRVRITYDGRSRELRLLAGLLFAFRIPQYPFDPGVAFGEPRATLHVVPLPEGPVGRALAALAPRRLADGAERIDIEVGRDIAVDLLDRATSEFFLDEDAETFDGTLRISIAGTLALVPPSPAPQAT